MTNAYFRFAALGIALAAGAALAQTVPVPPGGFPPIVLPKPTSTPQEFKPIPLIVPNPVLAFTGAAKFTKGGTTYRVFRYDITNKDQYAAALFKPAPDLPPCGKNANASRAWLDFYAAASKTRLYGFCALTSTADLGKISFTLPVGTPVPASVYVTLTDRRTGQTYTSNAVPTGVEGSTPPVPID